MSVRTDAELFRRLPIVRRMRRRPSSASRLSSERISCNRATTLAQGGSEPKTAWLVVSGSADVFLKEGDTPMNRRHFGSRMLAGELAMICRPALSRQHHRKLGADRHPRHPRRVHAGRPRVSRSSPAASIAVLPAGSITSLADINRARKLSRRRSPSRTARFDRPPSGREIKPSPHRPWSEGPQPAARLAQPPRCRS